MGKTTNYSIGLIERGAQDWKQSFDQIIESIDTLLANNQIPEGVTLKWGDVTNGKYLQADSSGVKCVGDFDLGSNQIKNLVIDQGAALPSTATSGQLFFKTSDQTLHVYANSAWVTLGAVSSASVKGAGGIVSTDVANNPGSILTRNASSTLTSIAPSSANQVLVSAANGTISYTDINTASASLQTKGALRVGSATGVESYLTAPTSGSGKVLVVDENESLNVKWDDAVNIVPRAFSAKGQILSGSGAGTAIFMTAPKANEVLVGDTSTSSGWTLKNINDIVGQNNAESSAFARVFANSNFG